MRHRANREGRALDKTGKWREFWGTMRMVAITFLLVGWSAYFYESCTGLTVATRRSLGRPSTAENLRSTLDTAWGFTIFGFPLLVLSEIMRRQNPRG